MADKKISQLTDGTSLQSGDFVVIARSGDNFKVDPTQFGSSIDVTGTVTADDLIASDGDGGTVSIIRDDATVGINNSLGNITWYSTEDGGSTINQGASIIALAEQNHSTVASGSRLALTTTPIGSTTSLNRLLISNNGDISFFEDTGTTPKFFWDASAESLGINVTDPIYTLEVQGEAGIELYNISGGGNVLNFRPSLGDANKYNMSISSYDHSGGGVGPADGLSINGADGVSISTGSNSARQERLRVDSSGNLLVGTTSDLTDAYLQGGGIGIALRSNNQLAVSRSGSTVAQFNRNVSDGEIVALRKDGTTVGSIGTTGSRLYAGTGDTGLFFNDQLDSIDPWNTSTNAARDAAIDLGDGSRRFKNLYLSGGVVLDEANLTSEAASTSGTSATQIASFAVATYGGAKFVVTAHDTVAGERYIVEILVTHDGTTAFSTEYAQVATSTALATYTVDINSGNVRLLATAASSNATNYRVVETLIDA